MSNNDTADAATITALLTEHLATGLVLTASLRQLLDRYAYIAPAWLPLIAKAHNLSQAEVMGVMSFYDDFHSTPPARRRIRICQAEACQAVGARELTAHACQRLQLQLDETRADQQCSLHAVYCLGLCANGPALQINEQLHARVDAARFEQLLQEPIKKETP